MNTETRIRYGSFEEEEMEVELRYNPHVKVNPWETWTDSERIFVGYSPDDLLTLVNDENKFERQGEHLHELQPEQYPSVEVVAADYPEPAMDLDIVPPVDVQKIVWDALKYTTEKRESVYLYELCEETAIDVDDAERASKLFMIQGLVEYASVNYRPFLTSEGDRTEQPDWIQPQNRRIEE